MRRSTDMDGNAGATGAAFQHPEQQTSLEHPSAAGDGAQAPSHDFEAARRYLELLAGGEVPHLYQPYYDPDRERPDKGSLARRIYGRLSEVWPELLARQQKGAAIAVTMAEIDGRGRKSANMVRPRAVWIEADGPLRRDLPLLPSMVVETSLGKHHYIYISRDLGWQLWHGVQQTLIEEYGSDPQASSRTQVLRLPGTLHQKDPDNPHLVRIVEELSSWQVYSAAEIAAAFPPTPTAPPRPTRESGARAPGSDWEPEKILPAFVAIDARLQERGPFTAQGDRPDDQAIEVDWSLRSFWLRAISAVHHASGRSDAGFELSCQVSAGDSSIGLKGCPSKFDRTDQRRVWDSLSNDGSELRGARVTIRTIYWIARDFAGWNTGRRGRPLGQPREIEVSEQAQAVADAGRWAVSKGLNRLRKLHAIGAQRLGPGTLKRRLLEAIATGLDPRTGVTEIGSLTLMAGKLGCDRETVRRYLRELEQEELIIKNRGNATSMLGTPGITIALAFPEGILEAFDAEPNTSTADPPISDQTGKTTPDFHAQAGWKSSRSPSSHEGGESEVPPTAQSPDQGPTLDQCVWPKLTTPERERLKLWLPHLPEVIAGHCSALAAKRGFAGTVGRLVDVLEFASSELDRVALHLVMEDAARRISYRGRDKPPVDLVEMTPGDCLGRFLRKLVTILGGEQNLPDTPGYAAIAERHRFVRSARSHTAGTSQASGINGVDVAPGDRAKGMDGERDLPKLQGNAYAAARHKRDSSAFS